MCALSKLLSRPLNLCLLQTLVSKLTYTQLFFYPVHLARLHPGTFCKPWFLDLYAERSKKTDFYTFSGTL